MILANIFENTTEVFRTIQLLISLGALTGIAALFLNFVRHNTSNTEAGERGYLADTQTKWIHTLYIGGIATLLLLEFIVYLILNNDQKDNIIDTITFGATLSSLIMSVVAIIFTIVSGRNGETQLGQITQATDDLRRTASTLTEFRTIAASIDSHIDNLNDQIRTNISQLSSDIDSKISVLDGIIREVRNDTKEVREHQLNHAITVQGIPRNEKSEKFSVSRFIMAGSYLGALALLCCCYAKQTDKTIEFNKLGDDFSEDSLDYVNGYLVASYACGIIISRGDMKDKNITYVDPKLEELCMQKIKTFIKESALSKIEFYLDSINKIREYFGLSLLSKEDLE